MIRFKLVDFLLLQFHLRCLIRFLMLLCTGDLRNLWNNSFVSRNYSGGRGVFPWTQDINWRSHVRSIYALCPENPFKYQRWIFFAKIVTGFQSGHRCDSAIIQFSRNYVTFQSRPCSTLPKKFPHSEFLNLCIQYECVKYRPEKLPILVLFTQRKSVGKSVKKLRDNVFLIILRNITQTVFELKRYLKFWKINVNTHLGLPE